MAIARMPPARSTASAVASSRSVTQSHRSPSTRSARWPIANVGSVPIPTRPGSSSSTRLRCSRRSSSIVVQPCPPWPTYWRASRQIGHSAGGPSDSGNCVPQVTQMCLVTGEYCPPRRSGAAEPPAGLTVGLAPAEGEGPDRRDPEDDGDPGTVVKDAVLHGEMPEAPVLRLVLRRDAAERAVVARRHGVALDHDVEPLLHAVASGGEDAVRVLPDVGGLLLVRAGAEEGGVVEPDGVERGDVWSPVRADGRDPVHAGVREPLPRVRPGGRGGVLAAVARVELGDRVGAAHGSSILVRLRL